MASIVHMLFAHVVANHAVPAIWMHPAGCGAVAYGGSSHAGLVVSTMDGSLLLLSPGSQFDPTQPDPAGLQVSTTGCFSPRCGHLALVVCGRHLHTVVWWLAAWAVAVTCITVFDEPEWQPWHQQSHWLC
jgi:hypothetical protein